MELDWALASLHHLAIFSLIAMIAAELALISGRLEAPALGRLGRIDAGYGISAAIVLIAGVARVFWGVKGAAYYGENSLFQAKITIFLLVGAISVWPTVQIVRWRRQARADAGFRVPAQAQANVRRVLWLEAALVALLPILAAGMARGFGS